MDDDLEVCPLPEGQYLRVSYPYLLHCFECEQDDNNIVLSNEVVIEGSQLMGIEAIVRFFACGHRVAGASASPVAVAMLLDKYEPMLKDE